MSDLYDLVVIVGPTASGKTSFAAQLAKRINGEIISADSRQVYRRMNLGTGKDYSDYLVDGTYIPVHLIDIADPGDKYNVFLYQQDFIKAYHDIVLRGKAPVLCGGSGLYIDAVTSGYRLLKVPVNTQLRKELSGKTLEQLQEILSTMRPLHNTTDTDNNERAIRAIEIEMYNRAHKTAQKVGLQIRPIFIGIRYDRQHERARITERLEKRLQQGMVEEVRQLLGMGISPDDLIYYGLEYKYITLHLTGRICYDDMFKELNTAIHQFAKRQMTWFRKMEREGKRIHWISGNEPTEEKLRLVLRLIEGDY
jgi:tRNA dimethylallyltransferase